MSFFDEVTAVWQSSKSEQMRIKEQSNDLTYCDRRAIDRVTQFCIDPGHKAKILDSAKHLYRRYRLHKGHDLAGLVHLNEDTQKRVIEDILQTIRTHYGEGFEVSYFDDDGKPFWNAVFILSW